MEARFVINRVPESMEIWTGEKGIIIHPPSDIVIVMVHYNSPFGGKRRHTALLCERDDINQVIEYYKRINGAKNN